MTGASRAVRDEEGMQPGRVRRVHGARRRRADHLLPGARRPVRGSRRDDGRGAHGRRRSCTRCSRRSSTTTAFSAATARPGQICSAVGMVGRTGARRAEPCDRRSPATEIASRPRRAARAHERQPVPLRRPQRDRRRDRRGLRGTPRMIELAYTRATDRRRRDPPRGMIGTPNISAAEPIWST